MAASPHDVESDAMLVMAAQEGDADAFSELFRRHYQQVRRVCARKLRDIREADEIAQAAFVKAYERLDRCGGDRRFGAWVQVIANNLCIDHMRAQARTTPTDEHVEDLDSRISANPPEDAVLHAEQSLMIERALATLPERQRDVVVARDVDGRRPPEIAAALGLSLGAVDSLLLRARRRLAASMQSMSSAESGAASLATTAAVSAVGGAAANAGPLARVASAVGQAVAAASYHVAAGLGMVPGMPSVVSQAAPAAAAGLVSLSPVGGALPHHHHQLAPLVAPINAAVSVPVTTPSLLTPQGRAGVNTTIAGVVAPLVSQLPTAPTIVTPPPAAAADSQLVGNVVEGVGAVVNHLLDGPAAR